MKRTLLLVATVAALAVPGAVLAQTSRCDALEGEDRARADALLAKLKAYDCCREPLAACLAATPRCPLAERLANDVCRGVQLSRDSAAIEEGFERRRRSMTGPLSAGFALEDSARVGYRAAPVTVVLFACTRCPFRQGVVLGLLDEVTKGDLEGKVKVYLRPFPLKNHPGSTEGGLALMASQRLGALWPYARILFRRFNEFDPSVLVDWARPAGLDPAAFELAMGEAETRAMLTESRKEGLRNKVASTPTLFINGRHYTYDLDPVVLVDVLNEEYERVTAKKP